MLSQTNHLHDPAALQRQPVWPKMSSEQWSWTPKKNATSGPRGLERPQLVHTTYIHSQLHCGRLLSFGEAGGKRPTQAASWPNCKDSSGQMSHLLNLQCHMKCLQTQKRSRSQERDHQTPGPRKPYGPVSQDGTGDRSPKRHQVCPCPSAQGQLSETQHPKGYQLSPGKEHPLPAHNSLWRKGQPHSGPGCIKLGCTTLHWFLQRAGTCRVDVETFLDVTSPWPLVYGTDTHFPGSFEGHTLSPQQL